MSPTVVGDFLTDMGVQKRCVVCDETLWWLHDKHRNLVPYDSDLRKHFDVCPAAMFNAELRTK